MSSRGELGANTLVAATSLESGTGSTMLRAAVEWERIASNLVQAVRKPSGKRTRAVRRIPPEDVERLRTWLLDHPASVTPPWWR